MVGKQVTTNEEMGMSMEVGMVMGGIEAGALDAGSSTEVSRSQDCGGGGQQQDKGKRVMSKRTKAGRGGWTMEALYFAGRIGKGWSEARERRFRRNYGVLRDALAELRIVLNDETLEMDDLRQLVNVAMASRLTENERKNLVVKLFSEIRRHSNWTNRGNIYYIERKLDAAIAAKLAERSERKPQRVKLAEQQEVSDGGSSEVQVVEAELHAAASVETSEKVMGGGTDVVEQGHLDESMAADGGMAGDAARTNIIGHHEEHAATLGLAA